MREFTFINSSDYNRRCFLSNVKTTFHTNPYYTSITGQDYFQLLSLLCPDFPRPILINALQLIVAESSNKEEIYQMYSIKDLQLSVALCFYYSEFLNSLAMQQLKSTSIEMKTLFSKITKIQDCFMYIVY